MVGKATAGSVMQGGKDVVDALGGVNGVVKDVGLPTLALSGKKIYDNFLSGWGAPASALAPPNPAALTGGLPVITDTATTGLVSQSVPLPTAA